MILPHDFGLTPIQTLARVAHATPSWRHSAFWSAWEKAFTGSAPALSAVPASSTDPTDPTATHWFESLRHVRIGALLVAPPAGTPLRAGVIALHGYGRIGPLAGERERWEPLAARGVATLAIRVRGFPGSARETGVLTDAPGGWIGHGLEALVVAEDAAPSAQVAMWILPEAVADVANAALALRRWMGQTLPVFVHGESLGGGLAVIAAARAGHAAGIARLAIGNPSLGDWSWRLSVPECNPDSAGAHVRGLLSLHQRRADKFLDTLRLADAALHARSVQCPTLCKLAERDDVVPAPSAAAVYNALGCAPGQKWRFITPFGHFDGGIRSARRQAIFERAVDEFLNPAVTPQESMALFAELLESGDRLPDSLRTSPPRAPAAQPSLFATEPPPASDSPSPAGAAPGAADRGAEAPPQLSLERILCEQYRTAGRTLDDLPYTPQFESLMLAARAAFPQLTQREAFHKLHNIRKAGRLPRLGRAPGTKPAVPPDDERILVEMVEHAVGSTGQRDQLPYTEAFDRLVWNFNQRTGRSLHAHEIWRLVATLSK